MQLAMIQDKIMPLVDVESPYLDRGIFFGDGVYEVIRSYNSRIFDLDDHLARFKRSLHEIRIIGVDIDNIRKSVEAAYAQSGIDNAKIYFHITRGSEIRNHVIGSELVPNFFMTITELPDTAQEKAHGIAVSTHPDWRWKRCDIKSLNLLANVLAKTDAEEKGCGEAILVNDAGEITEGSSSAFFAIFKNQLITRPLSHEILPSITRKIILEIAQDVGLTPVEKTITPYQAANADELFIAVTTKDIVGVVKFDDDTIADGKVGPYTKKLIKAFTKKMDRSI
jgi:D-alanine transaminase